MKPHDLALYRQPGKPAPHPDGTWAAVAVSRPDLEADAYESRLWRIPIDTGELSPLTFGPNDSAPAISPDGRWLAFLRTAGKSAQVFVAELTGGAIASEPRQLTDHPLGARGPLEFSDSALAYLAPVPEDGRYGTDPEVGPGKEPPRHITDFTYRRDGRGFYLDRPAHVFTVALADLAMLDDPLADPPPRKRSDPPSPGAGSRPSNSRAARTPIPPSRGRAPTFSPLVRTVTPCTMTSCASRVAARSPKSKSRMPLLPAPAEPGQYTG